ncbi:hypothetical protein IWW51_001414 [Coemansia sp. RSA 2702]|nr:hypothetical protein IWW54_003090 [Coemansia sp. RSA 2705]KAJ2328037.1 hypothetical protein IWW51_001414 [Coemansia sp. RSA 2702]
MKLGFGLVLVALAAVGSAQGPQRCSSNRVRRNAASLSSQEWASIANVLSQMNNDGWMSRFGASHDRLFSRVHGNTCFFPFHRRYVLEFENIARTYDPSFVVPYWDATESFRNPAGDPVLSATALGTNGEGNDHCLTTGIQANMQVTYPDQHCVRRNFDQGNSIGSWYAPEIISSYVQSDTSLATFRENIEYSIHGAVHLGLGGEMDTGYAAQDFSFMVHHANLDRLWWDWQNGHNEFFMYDGTGSNGPASLSDAIPEDSSVPFNGATVESVMVLGYGNVCYTYDSSPAPPQSYPSDNSGGSNNANSNANNNNNNNNNSNNANNGNGNGNNSNSNATPQNQQQGGSGSRNNGFVLSASPNAANRLLETEGIQNSLGRDIINRLFPGLGGRSSSLKRRDDDARPSNCGDPLPFPPRLTDEWVKMHKYDPERVESAHKHACEIVETLNNSTYVSPY